MGLDAHRATSHQRIRKPQKNELSGGPLTSAYHINNLVEKGKSRRVTEPIVRLKLCVSSHTPNICNVHAYLHPSFRQRSHMQGIIHVSTAHGVDAVGNRQVGLAWTPGIHTHAHSCWESAQLGKHVDSLRRLTHLSSPRCHHQARCMHLRKALLTGATFSLHLATLAPQHLATQGSSGPCAPLARSEGQSQQQWVPQPAFPFHQRT